MRLTGKHAAVTGGNSGIGLAIAEALAGEGASVGILGRDPATLASAADRIGSGTVATPGDISDTADLEAFYERVEQAFGGLDILVANAGIYTATPLEETTVEFFDRVSDVNFRGAFFTVQRALPLLRDGASVILITSTINESGVPGLAVYAATKAAVRSLARSLAAELLPRGIRVNAISPGIIDSPIFERLELDEEQLAGLKRTLEGQIPAGRMGTPEEVARLAVFLASDDSSYMTGCEVPVSGGLGQI
jgi:NAD(P)-dependent dehydrogenase (short-subunit alcohol dehydrogenase family)